LSWSWWTQLYYGSPFTSAYFGEGIDKDTLSQQLVGYYTTHQPDGVHIEARCTCEVKYEGVGHREIGR